MLKDDIYSRFENMSYESQKQLLSKLDEIKNDDTQAFDDNWNCLEVAILSFINCIKVIGNKLFK